MVTNSTIPPRDNAVLYNKHATINTLLLYIVIIIIIINNDFIVVIIKHHNSCSNNNDKTRLTPSRGLAPSVLRWKRLRTNKEPHLHRNTCSTDTLSNLIYGNHHALVTRWPSCGLYKEGCHQVKKESPSKKK